MEHCGYINLKYAIDKQGTYYMLALSEEPFNTQEEAIKAAIKTSINIPCCHHCVYLLVLKVPNHISTAKHLAEMGKMLMGLSEDASKNTSKECEKKDE